MKYLVKFQNKLIERKFYLDTDLKVKYFDNVLNESNTLDQMVTTDLFSKLDSVLVRDEKYLVIDTKIDRYHDELDKAKFEALQTVTLDRATIIYLNHKEDVLNDHFLPAFKELLNDHKATEKRESGTQIHIENSKNNYIEVSGKQISSKTDDKIGILSHERSYNTTNIDGDELSPTEVFAYEKGVKNGIPFEAWEKVQGVIKEEEDKPKKPSLFKKFKDWIKEG